MTKESISTAIFLGLAFVIAGIFLAASTGMIGDGQDSVISYTKKVEQY